MSTISMIPGFVFDEDDSFAKYATGKKILKNKHVKKIVLKRHHKLDDRKKNKLKKMPSSCFKFAPGSVVKGFANYCRIGDGTHSVGGSYPRAKAKEIWSKIFWEQFEEYVSNENIAEEHQEE